MRLNRSLEGPPSMLTTLVLVIHTLIAAALVGVILLQRSEGGALGIGAGPSGMMTARGAANLLTRATAWLATAFIATSILLAVLHGSGNRVRQIDPNLSSTTAAPGIADEVSPREVPSDPGLVPVAPTQPADKADDVPLAQ
jgi:preprotein translocase subunit SecG